MKLKYEYNFQTIEFEVVYRNRRTMAIQIKPPDDIRVLVPKGASEKEILCAVKSKSSWIVKKLAELDDLGYEKIDKKYCDGEIFMFLGENYPLKINIDEKIKKDYVDFFDNQIVVNVREKSDKNIKKVLEKWYRAESMEKILDNVKKYANYIKVKPRNIKVKTQKKRWGSCTSNRDMYFNWKISMAPVEVIDYIVLHEMCHLVHMNHSAEFWDFLYQIMPDYKDKKDWLKRNGFKMEI